MKKDLGIKIGTKEESEWTKIKEGAENEIAATKRMNMINELIVKKAVEMIEIEKLK